MVAGKCTISCTLPYSKALAQWRQVRRNYLFQGGYPRYHLICTPPRRGSTSWFPQSPGTVGYRPHPGGRSGTFIPGWLPRYHPNCTPPGRPPSWAPTPQSSFPATHILPTASVFFPKCSIIRAALTRARKRIIDSR